MKKENKKAGFLPAIIVGAVGVAAAIGGVLGYKKLQNKKQQEVENKNLIRFLLTFFLGWIGSLIINHTSLKPKGYTCRTGAYFILSILTWDIYPLVASICNFFFDPKKPSNIGYKKDEE